MKWSEDMLDMASHMIGGVAYRKVVEKMEEQADETLTPIERTYEDAYKLATGLGERHRAAHIRGLEAVRGRQPSLRDALRASVAESLEWCAKKVRR